MYASARDIEIRYGADTLAVLTDPGKTGTPDGDKIERALADAGEEIDGYIRQRYALPLSPPPGLLVRIEVDIAIYRLSESDSETTEDARKRYEDAIRLLARIADGSVSLGIEGPEPATARPLRASAQESKLGRESMRGAFI